MRMYEPSKMRISVCISRVKMGECMNQGKMRISVCISRGKMGECMNQGKMRLCVSIEVRHENV